jgi:cytosine/creatinine deaminase
VIPGFVAVPERDAYRLRNATVPVALLTERAPSAVSSDGLALVDLTIGGGRIIAVEAAMPSARPVEGPAGTVCDASLDLGRGLVWPCLIDVHTHLDKGHIWRRAPNPDGTFAAAVQTVAADRARHWSAEDVRRRMEFGLACSYAHGSTAVRTHLDSFSPQAEISWGVMEELRRAWAGRIELQAVSLVSLDLFGGAAGEALADRVAAGGGVLGAVAYMVPDIDTLLERLLDLAAQRRLDVDFHCDESGDVGARALPQIARAVLRRRFAGRVVCGHCCSLAIQPADAVAETLDLVVEAGIAVVSLPMCNLYLQDRVPGRTPRWRGATLLHEMKSRGIPIAVASDNCRDAFYGFGDHDMLEVFREATRICHLDRPYADWPRAVTTTPADLMRLPDAGRIGPGQPADLVLFKGRDFSELLSRPQADRVVLRNGRPIARHLPDYRELDDLVAQGVSEPPDG